jgi:signal transduction histidine kinase
MTRRRPRTAWQIAYDKDLNAALLSRSRWSIALALGGTLVASLNLEIADSTQMAARRDFTHTLIVLIGLVGLISCLPVGRRNPRAVSLGLGLSLTLVLAGYPFLVPNGLPITGASLSMVLMGLAVLLPWGMSPQIVLGAAAIVEFAVITWIQPQPLASGLLSIVISGAIVGVVGAALLDRYRRGAHEVAWQQAHLAAMGQDLARTQDPEVAGAQLVRHGLALIPASICLVAQRVTPAERYRVTHVAGPLRDRFETLLGFETPVDSPLTREISARGLVTMPQDAPDSDLGQILATLPGVTALYVSLDHGEQPVGVMTWIRRDHATFLAGERQLARDIGAQAALAIKTTQAIADLRRMNRLKSDFVSTVSHELRTPLNVILGYLDMLADQVEGAAPARILGRVRQSSLELLELVEATLNLNRIASGKDLPCLETVALDALGDELRHDYEPVPRAPGVRLLWEIEPGIALVTDRQKLKMIVKNLVGNALKFTSAGEVAVRMGYADGRCVVTVRDTGIGIAADHLPHVFDMFRQVDSSDARRFGGVGLGLYIVKSLLAQLGGTIEVESAPGVGSTFRLTLPAAPAAASDPVPGAAAASA